MRIVIITTQFTKWRYIDALRKEAARLYELLNTAIPQNQIYLVSVENTFINNNGASDQRFISATMENLGLVLDELKPDVVHVIETNPYLLITLLDGRKKMPFKVVFNCVDNNPLCDLAEDDLESILHISEYNECQFFCYSKYAFEILRNAGIRDVAQTLPLLDISSFMGEQCGEDRRNLSFSIGFASSPFNMDNFFARGINLLIDYLRYDRSEINLQIPWREVSLPPPNELISDNRVQLCYGFADMGAFFQGIDIYLLPFAEEAHNHASPHSFWEAVYYGKPVIVTNKVGIAPLVEEYEIGVVAEADPQHLSEAVYKLCSNYQYYRDRIRLLKGKILNGIIDQASIIDNYITRYKRLTSDPSHMMTLPGWREALLSNNRFLIKSAKSIKNYYLEQAEALAYRNKRFDSFPMNLCNIQEKQVLDLVISNERSIIKERKLEILDIAAGEGRISEVLINYGNVTVLENSVSMLKVLLERINGQETLTLINGDFLHLNLDNYNQKFDVITSFRFVRHFEYRERQSIYKKINELLSAQGIFLFDVPNKAAEIKLRDKLNWSNFNIYDVFWTKNSIAEELQLNGFKLAKLIGIGQYCFTDILEFDFNIPMSWVALAEKIDRKSLYKGK